MLPPGWDRRLTMLLVVGMAVGSAVAFGWLARRSPGIRFLSEEGLAHWIEYPAPPDPGIHANAELTAVFRRSFDLPAPPAGLVFHVRTFGRPEITVNGQSVPCADERAVDSKSVRTCDVTRQLHTGTNHVAVAVTNDHGYPALWLSPADAGCPVATDARWEVTLAGSAAKPARLASAARVPEPGSMLGQGDRPAAAFLNHWPLLVVLSLIAGVVCGALCLRPGWFVRGDRRWQKLIAAAAPATVALTWAALFGNNGRTMTFPMGFDAQAHLDYIRYILEEHTLPLASDGWEMYQPPLYYLVAAGALSLARVSVQDPAGVAVLRLVGLAAGVAQVAFLWGILRLIFPQQPARQAVGLAVGAFLPAHLYLFQYVTNEGLAATLGTGAVFLCLRILRDPKPGPAQFALLGACLGAALLTKLTALVLVAVVFTVLAARLWTRPERGVFLTLRSWGLALVVCAAVSGWHYARVWTRLGSPVVHNPSPASGFAWWQDPGYGTAGYFTRFGRSLSRPFYSVFYSYGDGIYSTLWGDGLQPAGNVVGPLAGPPWNYGLMAAGYWLALVPTGLILVGAAAAVVEMVRRPRAEWFLLVGLAVCLALAMVAYYLSEPFYGCVKAFYGLTGAASLCVFAALGFAALARGRPLVAVPLGAALTVWAVVAFSAFWVRSDAPSTQTWLGWKQLGRGRFPEAGRAFQSALKADPHNTPARLGTIELLARTRRPAEAHAALLRAAEEDPESVDVQLSLAGNREGGLDAAVARVRDVLRQTPGRGDAYPLLAELLRQMGQQDAAVEACREGLGRMPESAELHRLLARLLEEQSRAAEAAEQSQLAARLEQAARRLQRATRPR